jgi:hypothetical protein
MADSGSLLWYVIHNAHGCPAVARIDVRGSLSR